MKNRIVHMIVACVALAALVPAVARAQPPQYRVTGNRALGENDVIRILRASGWTPGAGAKRLAPLQEAYYREGYLLARVSVETSPLDSAAVVVIEEGEPTRVAHARVLGSVVMPGAEVVERLGIGEGDAFRPRELDERIERLLTRYDESGYPFAQVWVDSVAFDETANQVGMRITVVEGSARTITDVDVRGLEKTRPDLAMRIAGIRTGAPYKRRVLDDAYLRLISSRLFDSVEYPTVQVSSDGSGVDAILTVTESKRSHSFRGAVGYASAETPDEDRVLSGLVDLRLRNIGGSLKDFEAFWTNDGKQRSETRLRYRDRFFLGRQLTVGLRLEQLGQDTLYTWQSLGLEAEKPVGRAGRSLVSLSAGLHADRNIFSTGSLLRSWRYRVVAGFSFLRGNRRHTDFVELDLSGTWARKRNTWRDPDSTSTLNQFIAEAEGEATVSFTRLLHGRMAGAFRALQSNEELVPLSEQFYIGGARTLRGYRENQFHGRRVATLSTELLVGPGRWENGYLFVDLGYVFQETQQPDGSIDTGSIFPAGFGFGLRTGSPVGNIDLSFAVDDHLSLQQTKVHVLLEQNF